MKKTLCFVLLLLVFTSCNNQNCTDTNNKKFSSYSEAKQYLQTFDFQLGEEEYLQRSSWIKKANYYSCDGLVGYFTYETKNGKAGIIKLPVEIWNNTHTWKVKLPTAEKVVKVELDAEKVFPDINFANNVWKAN